MRRTIRTYDAPARSFYDLYIDPPPLRPHAEDALRHPSRIGNQLHYRDGMVTDMAGQPIKKTKGVKI